MKNISNNDVAKYTQLLLIPIDGSFPPPINTTFSNGIKTKTLYITSVSSNDIDSNIKSKITLSNTQEIDTPVVKVKIKKQFNLSISKQNNDNNKLQIKNETVLTQDLKSKMKLNTNIKINNIEFSLNKLAAILKIEDGNVTISKPLNPNSPNDVQITFQVIKSKNNEIKDNSEISFLITPKNPNKCRPCPQINTPQILDQLKYASKALQVATYITYLGYCFA